MAEPRTEQVTRIRMSAAEFLRLPETLTPTELIQGEVFVSPSPTIDHQIVTFNLGVLLRTLIPDGIVLVAPMDVHFDADNVFQPDVFWVGTDNKHCVRVNNAYWQGVPNLIIEVLSPGSGRRDRHTKFNLYEHYGVREYWIADPTHQDVEVWQLEGSEYKRVGAFGAEDIFTSAVLSEKKVELAGIFEE